MFLDELDRVARVECRLDPQRLTLIGISGGPDSLSLLDGLRRLGFYLAAAYFHHGLRPEADEEAILLADWMQAWKIPYFTVRGDVRQAAHRERWSVEEAARKMRYRYLFDQARQLGAQAVAVGHTADDQVESVLMHVLQGSGLAGLKGMDFRTQTHGWDAKIPLARPLLETWKNETLSYCAEQGLKPFQDATNQDVAYLRNRLRNELIPVLETYNPGFRQALLRLAKSVSGDVAYIHDQAEEAWARVCTYEDSKGVIVSRKALLAQPPSLQRELVRMAFRSLRGDTRDLGFEIVEQTIHWIQNPPRKGQANLAENLRIALQEDDALIAPWNSDLPGWNWPQMMDGERIVISSPGIYPLGNGWYLRIEIEVTRGGGEELAAGQEDPFAATLSADRLAWPLELRTRQPGDRFRPFGMGGNEVKLSDFFSNEKLPRRARARWPLVCSGGKIAWLPGLRPGEEYRVSAETRRIARLVVFQGDEP
ncbi:MAG TPA: tRNA lysidine(34) synthetase TilS [Anaerolineaceae bacterium]|nr:tRNA lysidine(34) synthetase TilS [Anaerolineaceae bacterium]